MESITDYDVEHRDDQTCLDIPMFKIYYSLIAHGRPIASWQCDQIALWANRPL